MVTGVAVVGICTWSVRGEWSKAWPELRHARLGYVALALGTVAIYYLVFILGWIRILAAWGMNVPYIAALQSEMVSMLAKYVPGGVWTPAARVAALSTADGRDRDRDDPRVDPRRGGAVGDLGRRRLRRQPRVGARRRRAARPAPVFALLCLLLLHPRDLRTADETADAPFGLAPIEPLRSR